MKVRVYRLLALFNVFLVLTSFSQNPVIDSLKQAFGKAKNDTTRCAILSKMVETEDDDKIWVIYNDQLLKLAQSGKEKTENEIVKNTFIRYEASAYNNRGILAQQNGDSPKALEDMTSSLKLEESIDHKQGVATVLINIGYIYNSLGNIKKAMEYWEKSLAIQEEIGDKKGMAYSLNNMGSVYHHQGDIYKALDYLHRGLKIQEEIGDKKGISNSLNNIAGIYGAQGDPKKALEYYQRSLKLREELKDQRAIATAYNNIGYTYTHMGNNDKAMEYYLKSLELRESLEDKKGIANSLINVGSSYKKKGDINKALECFKRANTIQQEIKHKEGLATSNCRIAEIMIQNGNIAGAIQYAQQSLQLAKELGFPENINDAATILKDIYKKQNKFKEAFEMYELQIQMRDSMNNAETKKEAVKKAYEYQYERKAAADSVKNADEQKVKNAMLAAQNAQLEQEKTARFALYGGLILMIVFAGFMFNRFRVTNKQKQIIELKEKETQQQNITISLQKNLVEEKQKEIIDSIHYASRIQQAILTSEDYIAEHFKTDFFVFYQPKDIVSGDFYWATTNNGKFYLAVCDCTGHGVPGAFMSLLNISYLNENVLGKKLIQPAEILNEQRQQIIKSLNPTGTENSKDGMDCVLCAFDLKALKVEFASANNPLWLVRNNEIIEYKGDKMPVGKSDLESRAFTQNEIDLQKGDIIYIFTDGFADQFGGPKGKKFMYKQLKETLLSISSQPLKAQQQLLKQSLKDWMGNTDQVDDITVIGIRV